ncbi:MAG: gliding motility-associated C-terminal domain-containing protein [Crocinitomicaceae bacterium]|jgi:gliding motility-associated-like protein|nr:gliding motility-associated C-terminal domain-containing protein [Crocinitomicaceae bacterium]
MKYATAFIALLLLNSLSYAQVVADFERNDTIACIDDCIIFSSTSTGDINNFDWTFVGGTPATYNGQYPPPICFNTAGDFLVTLTVTGPNSQSTYSETIHVGTYPDSMEVIGDTTIEMGGTAFLLATGYGGASYNWIPNELYDCPTCDGAFASPLLTQYCVVEYLSLDGCAIRDSALVTVKFIDVIDVPNSFSPNDNGVNEKVFVKGPGIEKMTFRIFDRYGALMFETKDQEEGWDGTMNGQALNPGAFLWTLEYTLIDGVEAKKSGTVTLYK